MDNISWFFWIGAEPLIYVMILLILILGIKGGSDDKKAFLITILALTIAVLLIKAIHLFYFEPRPFVTYNFTPMVNETSDASFPSRHTTVAAVTAFSYLFFKSKWSLFLLPAALWIGVSRVYVGVHYPLDILGGFLVGAISLIFALRLKEFFKKSFFQT